MSTPAQRQELAIARVGYSRRAIWVHIHCDTTLRNNETREKECGNKTQKEQESEVNQREPRENLESGQEQQNQRRARRQGQNTPGATWTPSMLTLALHEQLVHLLPADELAQASHLKKDKGFGAKTDSSSRQANQILFLGTHSTSLTPPPPI